MLGSAVSESAPSRCWWPWVRAVTRRPNGVRGSRGSGPGGARSWLWRVVHEFALVPLSMAGAMVLLAVVTIALDQLRTPWLEPARRLLGHLIGDQAAQSALASVATGMVTVASITFSLLLLAVQQTAASLSPVVFDQFVRRRSNQVYLGFFVGLSLYSYLVLAAVQKNTPPTLGATMAIGLTIVALLLLILLIYTTVDQMRPVNVIRAIGQHSLAARERQGPLLRGTRRPGHADGTTTARLVSAGSGYVIAIDLERIAAQLEQIPESVVDLEITLGCFVAPGDVVAVVRGDDSIHAQALEGAVLGAVSLSPQRDIDLDASAGIDQLANIAWTSASSAKHNPEIASQALDALRELIIHWVDTDEPGHAQEEEHGEDGDARPRITYPDNDQERTVDAMLALLVAAHESRQHQTTARTLSALANLLPRLRTSLRDRVATALHDSAATVIDQAHMPMLTTSVAEAVTALSDLGYRDAAAALCIRPTSRRSD